MAPYVNPTTIVTPNAAPKKRMKMLFVTMNAKLNGPRATAVIIYAKNAKSLILISHVGLSRQNINVTTVIICGIRSRAHATPTTTLSAR